MLIVIVIIGILAAALIPKLWNARGRANDTARKATLSQVAASLVAYQIDKWSFPHGCGPLSLQTWLITAWLDNIPKDPAWATVVWDWIWAWATTGIDWQYWYCSIHKNSQPDWWFVVMALAETEWGANYVVCSGSISSSIENSNSFSEILDKKCTEFEEWTSCEQWSTWIWKCKYQKWEWQLRYIYMQ